MVEVLSGRDAALLRAVADGRCELEPGSLPVLYVDGRVCCDTAAARRLPVMIDIHPSLPLVRSVPS